MVKTFWPESTPDTLYINASTGCYSMLTLMIIAEDYFGKSTDVERFNIDVENIHTNAITYDLHDASDWTLFYVLTRPE